MPNPLKLFRNDIYAFRIEVEELSMGSCHSCFNSADRIEVRILAEGTFALVVIVAEQVP